MVELGGVEKYNIEVRNNHFELSTIYLDIRKFRL